MSYLLYGEGKVVATRSGTNYSCIIEWLLLLARGHYRQVPSLRDAASSPSWTVADYDTACAGVDAFTLYRAQQIAVHVHCPAVKHAGWNKLSLLRAALPT